MKACNLNLELQNCQNLEDFAASMLMFDVPRKLSFLLRRATILMGCHRQSIVKATLINVFLDDQCNLNHSREINLLP